VHVTTQVRCPTGRSCSLRQPQQRCQIRVRVPPCCRCLLNTPTCNLSRLCASHPACRTRIGVRWPTAPPTPARLHPPRSILSKQTSPLLSSLRCHLPRTASPHLQGPPAPLLDHTFHTLPPVPGGLRLIFRCLPPPPPRALSLSFSSPSPKGPLHHKPTAVRASLPPWSARAFLLLQPPPHYLYSPALVASCCCCPPAAPPPGPLHYVP
jgi:hypothetical protein